MQVVIYSIPNCTYCVQAKKLAESLPQIIVDGEKIGGFTELKALLDG